MEKKKCFIITPIGDDGTNIRRHIEGIIDAAITPVIADKYEVVVAHRVCSPGSINKQVIESIYNADLVIANLTGLNPNVMYELAFRHAIRKPVITIMEKGDYKLPFDVVTERTIFYINDSQGVLELRENLTNHVKEIEQIEIKDIDNPIYSALQSIGKQNVVIENIESNFSKENVDAFKYIVERLDSIENKYFNGNAIKMRNVINDDSNNFINKDRLYLVISTDNFKELDTKDRDRIKKTLKGVENILKNGSTINFLGEGTEGILVEVRADINKINTESFKKHLMNTISKAILTIPECSGSVVTVNETFFS